MSRAEITLRKATMKDGETLFQWVNQPDSLAASLATTAPVAWNRHLEWLRARLSDPASLIWIVETGDRPIGQVRLQDRGEGPEVAIYITRDRRRRGQALAALTSALSEARDHWPGATAIARIKSDNMASIRLFTAAGFARSSSVSESLVYTVEL